MAPPTDAKLPDGVVLDLRRLAIEVSDDHLRRHPAELDRYGDAGREWCRHDNQHLLNWAVLDVCELVSFGEQLSWLANVLQSRGYPLVNLADNLRTAAATVRRNVRSEHTDALAEVLARGAGSLDRGN